MKPQLATIKPEQVSRAKTKSDLVLGEVIRHYEKEKKNILKKELFDEKANYAFRIKVPTLSQAQIAFFCQHEEAHRAFPLYLNSLIQKSYNSSNNDFTIPCNIAHDALLFLVQGTKEQPLNITIQGNTGDCCARYSKYLNLTINGNTKDSCASASEHITLMINSNTRHNCASASEHITLMINGNTKDACAAWSKFSKITISGSIGTNPSRDAAYFTNNPTTYEHLTELSYKVTLL